MLVTALELEEHRVDEASNAEEGLNRLHEARYNLVLSDYAMPEDTGTWMFSEASRPGVQHRAAPVIVTAQPFVRETPEIAVINEPFDLDSFLDRIPRSLESREVSKRNGANPGGDEMAREGSQPRGYKVELVLYVSSASPVSIQARRNLEQLLSRFATSQVQWSVHDLGREPLAGVEDRIAFTPTLVKRFPEPRMWVLGNLRETDLLADMLRLCGVESNE